MRHPVTERVEEGSPQPSRTTWFTILVRSGRVVFAPTTSWVAGHVLAALLSLGEA